MFYLLFIKRISLSLCSRPLHYFQCSHQRINHHSHLILRKMKDSERKKHWLSCSSLTSFVAHLSNFWKVGKRLLHCLLVYYTDEGNKPFLEVDSQPWHAVWSFGLHGWEQIVSSWAAIPWE